MKKMLYAFYKKFENNKFFATLMFFGFDIFNNIKNINLCSADTKIEKAEGNNSAVKAVIISDEMTYENFKNVCDLKFLTPQNWKKEIDSFKPDVFICESAWSGIDKYKDIWRGKIYKSNNLIFENRKTLFKIIEYCKKKNIKTVFWNKEDPVYFDDDIHNFSDTAIRFDYIFTTAQECIKGYAELGNKNAFLMGFGFSPEIFNCPKDYKKEKKAVFAGSWYADHEERCRDMEKIFDTILEKNISLEIYDRYSESSNPVHKYPDKYKKYIHKAVPYKKLGKILRNAEYAININTEKKSDTMFARRVFEIMASRCIVISNESVGMEKLFGDNIWFVGKDFDFENAESIIENNYNYVMKECTNNARIKKMFDICGLNNR